MVDQADIKQVTVTKTLRRGLGQGCTGVVCAHTLALKDEAGVGHGGVPRPEVGGKKRRGLATH